jgi:hypothetical protein
MPTPTNLGEIAPKIKLIMDLVKSSEGIVVIYSQYVWSGIVPCAIALEHMGFNRHGTRKMLVTDAKNINPVFYKDFKNPSYAILTGAESIMGSTKIEDILPILNNPKNSDGSAIKVILMTPIAGEGLSFKNAREMHILEPWYHFNRTEQVIGRTIRTCSHKLLPPEERNVTVYLHACVQDANTNANAGVEETGGGPKEPKAKKAPKEPKAKKEPKEPKKKAKAKAKQADVNKQINTISPDIHAYKISARKLYETHKAEEIIRNNAIDCALLENLNYYPKNIFQMSISMRTSQGDVISHTYGDDPSTQPQCVHPIPTTPDGTVISNNKSMRSELFTQVMPTSTLIVQKYITERIIPSKNKLLRLQGPRGPRGPTQNTYYFTIDELVTHLRKFIDDDMIIYDTLLNCIHPNKLIPNWKLLPHLNGIIAIPDHKSRASYIKMVRLKPSKLQNPPRQPTIAESEEDIADDGKNKEDAQIKNEVTNIVNNIIGQIKNHDPSDKEFYGKYYAYTIPNSLNWEKLAEYIISLSNPPENFKLVAEIYAKTGAFIKATEISLIAKDKGRDYVGFVNIFATNFNVTIYEPQTGNFRDANQKELDSIKSKRKTDMKPEKVNTVYGILEPIHNKKDPAQLFTNQFKLIGNGTPGPVSKGAVCEPKSATEIKKYLNYVTPLLSVDGANKNALCIRLAIELMKKKWLFIYPEYKP